MAGARGPLKVALPEADDAVAPEGSIASKVKPLAPNKPKAVAEDPELNELWDEYVPQLDEAGFLARCDALAVEMTLRHFVAARAASRVLMEDGPTKVDEKNKRLMKNPAEVVMRGQSEMFLKYAAQLGLTFVARARTPAASEGGSIDGNPFEGIG